LGEGRFAVLAAEGQAVPLDAVVALAFILERSEA
jgi:hypothetical protein